MQRFSFLLAAQVIFLMYCKEIVMIKQMLAMSSAAI